MNVVVDHYETYDEDGRLFKDNAHKIEFLTTVHFLDEIIKPNSKVLDVGAGTGAYSFYLGEKDHEVMALDLTPKHVEIIKERAAANNLSLKAVVGNAMDLSQFEENSFDVVLCLGPIYHLINKEDKNKCITECLGVLKKGGTLAVAYINKYATFVNMINRAKENINDQGLQNIVKNGLEYGDERDCFYFSTYHEMESLMNEFGIRKIEHVSSDGIGGTLRDQISQFTEQQFEKWMEYHLMTCRDSSLIGYSQHGLYICEKI